MIEQIDMFYQFEEESRLSFDITDLNDDGSYKLERIKDGIEVVCGCSVLLNKEELKTLCRACEDVERGGMYVYEGNFLENGKLKRLTVRFGNYTTSSKLSVFEFIDMYFDKAFNGEWGY